MFQASGIIYEIVLFLGFRHLSASGPIEAKDGVFLRSPDLFDGPPEYPFAHFDTILWPLSLASLYRLSRPWPCPYALELVRPRWAWN